MGAVGGEGADLGQAGNGKGGHQTAVDVDAGAGHEAGLVGCQVGNEIGDLRGLTFTA